jgi:hypothetical protein
MPANRAKPVYAPYIEHVPPDVTACIFWLKNRDPQHWRDSQQMEHVLGKYLISDKPMTEEPWAKERADVIDEPRFDDGRENGSIHCVLIPLCYPTIIANQRNARKQRTSPLSARS